MFTFGSVVVFECAAKKHCSFIDSFHANHSRAPRAAKASKYLPVQEAAYVTAYASLHPQTTATGFIHRTKQLQVPGKHHHVSALVSC